MSVTNVAAYHIPRNPESCLLGSMKKAAIGSILATILVAAPPSIAVDNVWNLGNGQVRFTDPLRVSGLTLKKPRLLGSGGGGAVFAFESSNVAIKVSWIKSRDSVEQECRVLKEMEKQHVQGVEQCLENIPYPSDPQRTIIALRPVMENAVSSVAEVDPSLQQHSVECIMRNFVHILASGVATIDVQPLISTETGDVLFIDLTEARILPTNLSFIEKAFASSFYVEIMSLIPDYLEGFASRALLQELREVHGLSKDLYNVLREQTISQETSDYIDSLLGS